jgi:hypothetical protein
MLSRVLLIDSTCASGIAGGSHCWGIVDGDIQEGFGRVAPRRRLDDAAPKVGRRQSTGVATLLGSATN